MMEFNKKALAVFGACVLMMASAVSSAGNVITETFEDYTAGCDAVIGNWTWRELQYSDAGCSTFAAVVPGYDQGPAQLKDLFSCPYYNVAGLINDPIPGNSITGQTLAIADNAEGNATACHRIQAALEVTTGSTDLGEGQPVIYTFAANVRSNQYGDNSADSEVGIMFTVLDIDAGYAAITEQRVPVVPSDGSVEQTFEVDLTGRSNILVQAGFYAQANADDQAQAQWDDFTLDWAVNDSEAAAQEAAACADTSVIRFEDAFGNAEVTCKTDTYTWPADAEDWAGFGDTARGDYYPMYFPNGGTITFTGEAASAAKVSFQLENRPFPNNALVVRTEEVEVTANGTYSVDIPADLDDPYYNLLLYVGTRDVPVKVADITVTGSETWDPLKLRVIPTLPIWGIFGLITLLGWMGLRRRR